jgi:MFS family permease
VLISALFGGFFESGFTASISLLALTVGMTGREALLAVTAVGLGSFAAQYLLGLLADRHGGAAVLLGCAGLLCASLGGLTVWPGGLVLLSLMTGAFAGGLYTVAVVYGVQENPAGGSARLISLAALTYTAGSTASPTVMGVMLEAFGTTATLGSMTASSLALCLMLLSTGVCGPRRPARP